MSMKIRLERTRLDPYYRLNPINGGEVEVDEELIQLYQSVSLAFHVIQDQLAEAWQKTYEGKS